MNGMRACKQSDPTCRYEDIKFHDQTFAVVECGLYKNAAYIQMRFTFKYVKVNDFKDDPPLSLRLLFKCGLQSRKYTSPFK